MYIYGTYIPPFGGASLSLTLSSSHQAQNIITKPLIAPSYDLSHIFPIFSTCTTLLSTAPLLCLSYCNPSCCPLATLHYIWSLVKGWMRLVGGGHPPSPVAHILLPYIIVGQITAVYRRWVLLKLGPRVELVSWD